MQESKGNVRSNVMCTYSWSCASKRVSTTHHMYLLMVTCNKINELTCSVRNNTPLLEGRRLHWPRYFEKEVAKVRTRRVTHLLFGVHRDFECGILPTWQGRCYGHYKIIHLFHCTWLWVNTCDVSQRLPYLHVTMSKCTWCYLGHFLDFLARDHEYILLYFDTVTWLVVIG